MARSKSSSNRNRKPRELSPQERVVEAFLGCARCSFFLTGYRLLREDFETAVDESEGGQLELTWDQAVKRLVQKSYGSQIEQDAYYFQGSCKECRRIFVYEENGEGATLRIAIKNRP